MLKNGLTYLKNFAVSTLQDVYRTFDHFSTFMHEKLNLYCTNHEKCPNLLEFLVGKFSVRTWNYNTNKGSIEFDMPLK